MYKISSEIYKETDLHPVKSSSTAEKVVSKFKFHYPQNVKSLSPKSATTDKDGDLMVNRKPEGLVNFNAVIEIEHAEATVLQLVGLQVWRGALLLADFCIFQRNQLHKKQLLELGAGVGLTSIAACLYAQKVICTDVDIGGILDLIRSNIRRNCKFFKQCEEIEVLECDFMKDSKDFSKELKYAFEESDLIVAADVIYDDDLTDAFIRVIDIIFATEKSGGKKKEILIALEKRYVFTLSECDAVAPMFEYFIKQTMDKPWHFEYIPLDFPQYFQYDRCKQLVLLKLTSNNF